MKKIITFVALFGLLVVPLVSSAEHRSSAAGQVIDSNDSGITPAHEGSCEVMHYHGTLNGVADPNPNGCGHGQVTLIAHGDGDGETLPAPAPAEKSLWSRFWSWVGSLTKEDAVNVIDVAAEANGIPPPGTVSDAVDITREATPSIMENIGNIEEYRENVSEDEDTLGIYNNLDNVPEEPTLSQRFFKWFNSLVD